ncbi:T9SS type A sorting domain-containing protein [Ulvibacter litoralis]|uniref:Por secretion system C-terminal sorting domain-containing protein n=1 Tax=Ulvibacter litoralis TaxID=227084 RepID=A0A1G7CYF5_9FLAO|nr:T9SS type A sorting domain-containing protein [Ulvibacter litoralis]GHC45832.1 hypothetical protein GCM10008083_05940 [Ulvibacter litoralis]SDE43515.1 Por secretion system C-terminal sorting domain-containing protein [Ulvibacter litoralis]
MKTPLLLLFLFFSSFQTFAQTPINDACADRISITVTTTGTTNTSAALGTATPTAADFLTNCETSISADYLDVWYEFTMPVDGNIQISNAGGTESFTLYDACEGTELRCFFGGGYIYDLTVSTTYVLRYAERTLYANNSSFNIQAYATIANDDCSDRETISVTTATTTTVNANFSAATPTAPDFITSCETSTSTDYLDVWYEFTMPVDGNIQISNAGGTESFTLYDACEGTELRCFFGGGYIYNLTESTTYVLRYAERTLYANDSNFNIQAYASIANDDCLDRETISVTTTAPITVSTDFSAATPTAPDFITSCETSTSADYLDVWYEFTMPVAGNIQISNAASSETFTLYDACEGTELHCFSGNDFFYNLTEDTTYVLRYAERTLFANSSDFDIQAYTSIANDDCANKETISVTTAAATTVSADFSSASPTAPDFVTNCETSTSIDFLDVWYEFTMPVAGNIQISNAANTETFTLYDACEGTELHCFSGNDFFYNLTEDTTYVLRYAERTLFANSSDFDIQAYTSIANDDCENKETISVTTAATTTVSADFSAASPTAPDFVTNCETSTSIDFLDVWYEFTMPVTGNIRITDAANTETFTLYDACEGTELYCFTGNDFFYGLTESTTYVLRYAERTLFANNSSFDLQAFEALENDTCASASFIDVGVVTYSEYTNDFRRATESMNASCDNTSIVNLDFWYEFVMPVDGNIEVSNISNSEGVSLFDSCGGTELSCFSDDGLFFSLTAGTTYYIRLSKRADLANEITFRIQAIEAPLASCNATTEFISGIWSPTEPNLTTNAIIRVNYNTEDFGSFSACSLYIDTGVVVTVEADDYIEVGYGVNVNGTLNVNHQGNLVQRDADAIALNNGDINVNVTTPVLKPRDFMVLGSPMDSETRDDVFGNAFRVLHHTTANFVPDATVAAAFPDAENFADDNGDNWSLYTGVINASEGFLVWPQASITDGDTSYDLVYSEGTLNNGDISFPVAYNTTKNDSPNILANPYASSISATDFINQNAMVDEVYFWEHFTSPNASLPGYNGMNFSMEDISMYNLMGGVAAASDPSGVDSEPDGFISTGQGFGIKATASGSALFTNSMRRLSNNNTLRFDDSEVNKIWLSVQNRTYTMQNTALIGFTENATAGIDNGYDSRRLATVVSLYSHLEDGSGEFSIQSREAFDADSYIPLGFSTQLEVDEGLPYIISIANMEGLALEASTVYLVDTYLGITTNLSESDYQFTATAGTYNNRFILQFKSEILGTTDNMLNRISLFPNPAQDQLTISVPYGVLLQEIDIYDATGRVLLHSNLEQTKENKTIDVSTLSSATYFVVLKSSVGTITKQLIKN